MSKYVKGLEMAHLDKRLQGVQDVLVVDLIGMESNDTMRLRRDLREKGIHVKVVKNALAKLVLQRKGMPRLDKALAGTSALAWGAADIVELAKELLAKAKKNKKFAVRGGCVSNQQLDEAGVVALSKMPGRPEMLAKIAGQILGPGSQLAAALLGPGGKLASQIKEKGKASDDDGAPAAENAG